MNPFRYVENPERSRLKRAAVMFVMALLGMGALGSVVIGLIFLMLWLSNFVPGWILGGSLFLIVMAVVSYISVIGIDVDSEGEGTGPV